MIRPTLTLSSPPSRQKTRTWRGRYCHRRCRTSFKASATTDQLLAWGMLVAASRIPRLPAACRTGRAGSRQRKRRAETNNMHLIAGHFEVRQGVKFVFDAWRHTAPYMDAHSLTGRKRRPGSPYTDGTQKRMLRQIDQIGGLRRGHRPGEVRVCSVRTTSTLDGSQRTCVSPGTHITHSCRVDSQTREHLDWIWFGSVLPL